MMLHPWFEVFSCDWSYVLHVGLPSYLRYFLLCIIEMEIFEVYRFCSLPSDLHITIHPERH